jgi:hypothetical protein
MVRGDERKRSFERIVGERSEVEEIKRGQQFWEVGIFGLSSYFESG